MSMDYAVRVQTRFGEQADEALAFRALRNLADHASDADVAVGPAGDVAFWLLVTAASLEDAAVSGATQVREALQAGLGLPNGSNWPRQALPISIEVSLSDAGDRDPIGETALVS